MRLSVPKLGAQPSGGPASKSKKLIKLVIQLAVLVIIVGGAYFLLHQHNNSKKNVVKPKTVNQIESQLSDIDKGLLAKKDYEGYQSTKALLVQGYLVNKDTVDAQKVLDDVFANVPQDKIASQTYFMMVNLQVAKNDNAGLKKYLTLLIAKLKSDGDSKGAAAEQKYLDSLK